MSAEDSLTVRVGNGKSRLSNADAYLVPLTGARQKKRRQVVSRTVVLPNGESVVATHAWWGTDGSVEVNVNAIYLETRTGSRKILYEEGSTRNDWPGQTFHSLADRLRGQIHKGGEPLVLLEWLQQQKKLSPRIKLVE